MQLTQLLNSTSKVVKRNSSEILSALSIGGLFTTSYLAAKAHVKAVDMVREEEHEKGNALVKGRERNKAIVKLVWKVYVPPAVAGALTTTCIVASSRASSKQTAAAVAAYSIADRAFSDYKEKVVEQLGETKEQAIRDELAQERVSRRPAGEVIITGPGQVLCCELYTHRYFRSDMETLRKAENQLNSLIVNEYNVPLDEFYDLIGLPNTSHSDKVGWDSDKLMELQFSTVLSEDGEPCLAFDYSYIKPL